MSVPTLLPEQSSSSLSQDTSTSSVAVSDVLLRILSKLTVYQSLPETSSSAVVAVRDEMLLVDALALFIPSKDGGGPSFTHKVIEVLGVPMGRNTDVLLAKSQLASERLSKALQAEATRKYFPECVANFLSVYDLMYFLVQNPAPNMTVSGWIKFKQSEALKDDASDWVRFCLESTLLQRCSLSMSPGVSSLRKNSILSSSTMNMSVSNMLKQSTSMGDLISPGNHAVYWKSQLRTARMGGSSLVAVCDLLARPWQTALPLTVETENGVDAIFAYTTLPQLMAHVSMNCSDKLLEPFFSMDIAFAEFATVANEHLEKCPLLNHDLATLADAIEVLQTSPFALLMQGDSLEASVTHDDVLSLLGDEVAHESKLATVSSPTESMGVMSAQEFPCSFSLILENILKSRMSALVVVEGKKPLGIITVRDVWDYVMQGASALRD